MHSANLPHIRFRCGGAGGKVGKVGDHLLARLAPPDFKPDPANRCFSIEEYLDCGCVQVDPDFEAELTPPKPQIMSGQIGRRSVI
jgi:hypothetical protein